jgi:Mg/Co/Ni transporter MgtE
MLAVPVVNHKHVLEGMVVIDDIVDDLLGDRIM